eukprot:gene7203-11519_t
MTEWVLSNENSPFSYDPLNCFALQKFKPIKSNTECIFAKSSKVWGSNNYDVNLSLEENILSSIPMLIKFFSIYHDPNDFLDGFIFEIKGDKYGDTVENFAKTVANVLKIISENDPSQKNCIANPNVSKKGWHFEFNSIMIFVTTFAPCYPKTNARYAFGVKDSCFILLQPYESFSYHELSPDTPHTNWDNPKTERDKIRIAFKDSGRQYFIPESVYYPTAEHIVKPEIEKGDFVNWWKYI